MFVPRLLLPFFALTSLVGFAQRPATQPGEGQVENAEITIEKDRKIELPEQNRNFEKIPPLPESKADSKITYEFPDRKLSIGNPRFNPTVQPLSTSATNESGYSNYLRAGAGNYGRILAEGSITSRADLPYGLTIRFRHNSTATGPVNGRNSAISQQEVNVSGRYMASRFRLDGIVGFDRNQFYFYGYGLRPNQSTPERSSLQQTLNKFSIGVGVQNTNQASAVDYSLKTRLTSLGTRTNAAEVDWGTNLTSTWKLSDTFLAHLGVDAFVTQRTDSLTDHRNLFRVKPTFQYKGEQLNVTVGFNAVHETDARRNLSATHGYPVVNVDFALVPNLHFFVGFDGDVVRNTLTNFLNENEFLGRKVDLLNTNKLREFYGGSKGTLGNGFSYEARFGLATYRNFYVFNNSTLDTSRFEILYDRGDANVLNVIAQVAYQSGELWRSSLKVDVFSYDLSTLEKPWHRPAFTTTWNNTFTFSKKLIINADVYFVAGLSGKNFPRNRVVDLPNILDLNLKSTYLFTDQISAFVSLNNLLGKSYERYMYYPRQSLNFLAGLSYSF